MESDFDKNNADDAPSEGSNPDSYLHQYPGLKEELRALFHGLEEGEESELDGRVFNDFRILREIGSGGMATVYEAEQISLGRKVALKILPTHMSYSDRAVKKFLREAEAGGRQTHPAIVAIFAVGLHEKSHYIAQELVANGFTLHHGIDRIKREREFPEGYFPRLAKLFAEVADGLQHAHESGVIHRDVKPSNILLTPEGKPKVSDFGMARVDGALALSRTGEFSGTPFYMSPEQALGKRDKIDRRTDIYSLGVTLFECLTLKVPFGGVDTHAVLKRIVNNEPGDPRKFNPRVPRDLATLCLKAMDKEPERRYQTMADLAQDLRRFVDGEEILARPIGTATRMVRRLRRNPALTGLTVLAGISVLLLFIYMLWSYPQILKERNRAVEATAQARMEAHKAIKEAAKLDAVNRFLREMFSSPNPRGRDRDMKVADVLDRAAGEAGEMLAGQPETEASLRNTLAGTYFGLGLYGKAKEQYERATSILEATLGLEHPDTLAAMTHLATAHRDLGEFDEARALYEKVISLQDRILGAEHRDTLLSKHNLATTLTYQGELEPAASLLGEVLEIRRRVLGEENMDTLDSSSNLATLLIDLGEYTKAAELLRNVCRVRNRIQDNAHPDSIGARVNLACALTELGEFEEAEALATECLEMCKKVLGKDHPNTLVAEFTLGSLFMAMERYPEAETVYRRVMENQRRVLGRSHPNSLAPAINLGYILSEQDKDEEANELYAETLAVANRVLPSDHLLNATLLMFYGGHLAKGEQYEEAEELLLKGLVVLVQVLGETDPDTQDAIASVVQLYEVWGKPDQATEYRDRLLAPHE